MNDAVALQSAARASAGVRAFEDDLGAMTDPHPRIPIFPLAEVVDLLEDGVRWRGDRHGARDALVTGPHVGDDEERDNGDPEDEKDVREHG